MTDSFHKDESKSSPAEDQLGNSVETNENSSQGGHDFSHNHIVDAFIFFGHGREEAEQWIRTSLKSTQLFLDQSLRIEPKRWSDKYPTTPRNDIQDALRSDIGAALYFLTGGVEEKYNRPRWTPIPRSEFSIRTKDLFERLAANPEYPDDIGAEKQIERIQKELERISEKIRKGKATLPYRLMNAPDCELITLESKGKAKDHEFIWASVTDHETREEIEASIKKEIELGNVAIENYGREIRFASTRRPIAEPAG